MERIIYVFTGEVKAGKNNTIIRSTGIGSCIVITSYDKLSQTGAMAHIMLPGKAPENRGSQITRYASDTIDELINIMNLNGTYKNNLEVCLAGGANILQSDNNIGQEIITSVEELLKIKKIQIMAKSLGGTERRSVSLDMETGCLTSTIGDGTEQLLWKFIDI